MKLIVHEDEHILVTAKPPGWNTHAPSPYAGEGLYEWLKHREPRWSTLAIIHRLDKETSGLIVFGKTPAANRSLTVQFEQRLVRKKYLLLTDKPGPAEPLHVKTALVRVGDKYVSRPLHAGGEMAETIFIARERWVEAEPLTGKTHQIRVHAAASGFPVLGDTLYGGTAAKRVFLHAAELALVHPATGEKMVFRCAPQFEAEPSRQLREAVIDRAQTDAFRLIHGSADGWPGLHVDRLGGFLLAQSATDLTDKQRNLLDGLGGRGVYFKRLDRETKAAPEWVVGEEAPEAILIRENGLKFELRFSEGYSVGLFLDQRDNRRRFLSGYVGAKLELAEKEEVLNTFAYTCGFSVAAAKAGARVTSLDLSKKYLEWGRRNFDLNGLDASAHDFIFGDSFDWMRRLAKKRRLFDTLVLDPPTFSRSKESGVFQAEKHYGNLIEAALPLVKPGGFILASTNAATLEPERFLDMIDKAFSNQRRRVIGRQYIPQPPDFPVHRQEPAYLKTVWLQAD